jgi:membrane-associated phospholipid phosphatase
MLAKLLKKDFNSELSAFGGVFVYCLIGLAFLLLARWEIFIELAIGFIAALVVMFGIRTFYFKERPQKIKHNSYLSKINASSFPSIHALRSTILATILAIYFNKWQLILPLALIPVFACYSRLAIKKHDSIDITFGVVIGVVVGWLITLISF